MIKARYKIFFLIFLLCLLSSCQNDIPNEPVKPEQPNVPKEEEIVKITFDTNEIVSIKDQELFLGDKVVEPFFVYDKDLYTFIGWSTSKEEFIPYDFSLEVFESFTLYGFFDNHYKDYSYFLDEYVPNVITTSIDLPKSYEKLMLMWSSSDAKILTNEGILNKPRKEMQLFVYLDVYDNGHITHYEKEVKVEALTFKTIEPGKAVFGYYSSWGFKGYTEEMLNTCDVINLCFGYVSADYGLILNSIHAKRQEVLKAHDYGIRVVLSVQGYGSEGVNFSNAAKTEEGRKKLATAMLNACIDYNFDGIDIDWEYPGYNTGTSTSLDRINYTKLLIEIKQTLKSYDEDLLLTAAIPGGPYLPSRFEIANVSNALDYIHIMTYDLHTSSKASHHTALYDSYGTVNGCSANASVNYFINQGADPKKLICGIAFYGRMCNASSLASSASNYKSITYNKIVSDYLSRLNNGVEYHFDEVAKAPYLLDTSNNIFITYDDQTSIMYKCNYVKDKGLGGVMIWELAQDDSDVLMHSINENLKK